MGRVSERKNTDQLMSKKPFEVYILTTLMVFLSMSAFLGAYILLSDTTGNAVGLPDIATLSNTFSSYLYPGLILGVLFGMLPAIISFSLLQNPKSKLFERLNIYKDKEWPWTYSVYISIGLLIWMIVETWIFRSFNTMLQLLYFLFALVLLIATLLPRVMRFYSR